MSRLDRRESITEKMNKAISTAKEERQFQIMEKDIDEALEETTLMHTSSVRVDKKDFSQEVRGSRDIEHFLSAETSEVLLDIPETDSESIVHRLLSQMIDSKNETISESELNSLIFANEAKTIMSESIQAYFTSRDSGSRYDWEQSWLCVSINVPTLKKRRIGIARLKQPVNLGIRAEEVRIFILILCPSEVKGTKNALEAGRTFSTLFSDIQLRHDLLIASTEDEFKESIKKVSENFAKHQSIKTAAELCAKEESFPADEPFKWYHVGRGVLSDLKCRIPFYVDDYLDGIRGKNTIQKTISTTMFLYFSMLLPAVALGVLNSENTHNSIAVREVIVGQTIGGLIFVIFCGQPLVVVMTTAPLAIFIKIIYSISFQMEVDFLPFYAAVGLWNMFFLILYSFLNLSLLMKYCSRSTEEIFGNFITIALITDALKHLASYFSRHYYTCPDSSISPILSSINETLDRPLVTRSVSDSMFECHPEQSFFALILTLGTVALGLTFFNFTKTPYLSAKKRELLSDYALPVAVIIFSIIGSSFTKIDVKVFSYPRDGLTLKLVDFSQLTTGSFFVAMALGFSLSLLFFMDQNISASLVNSPDNKLEKGTSYHWDLLVIGLINGLLCIFGLPFLHAVLPHSPLHVKCLADTEERVESGYVRDIIVRVRETRLTNLFANILIGISMLFLSYVLDYIPSSVLDGLFIYIALTALYGNQMFERVLLFFMEQSAYPPNHYIRRVPQRKIHMFTACQVVQLGVLCIFGFTPWPYIKMIFPLVILTFLPVRQLLIPRIIEKKYLDVIDS
ncbi:solute carrier family 4 member 11 isoform X2 [Lepeophtheirus salmonis]|nr:sodium bicarbonate transporter-like protein 11 isoform X2 [Lepeophtheirus salmonis]XP_040575079.1 sodium bicarbonate transporter-like protein 11 isoform X2 [Lepeophtheirus salmonis]